MAQHKALKSRWLSCSISFVHTGKVRCLYKDVIRGGNLLSSLYLACVQDLDSYDAKVR